MIFLETTSAHIHRLSVSTSVFKFCDLNSNKHLHKHSVILFMRHLFSFCLWFPTSTKRHCIYCRFSFSTCSVLYMIYASLHQQTSTRVQAVSEIQRHLTVSWQLWQDCEMNGETMAMKWGEEMLKTLSVTVQQRSECLRDTLRAKTDR